MTAALPNSADARRLLDGYSPLPGGIDEMVDSAAMPRSHWRSFISLIESLGPAELQRRWEQARVLIHENGVTYNINGDPPGMDRPWKLDAIPVVHSAADWASLSRGITQRARLLDAMLTDFYGPQRLLRERVIRPDLVFAQSGFLRACHGLRTPQGRYLHLYGCDLGRAVDGSFCVVHDRTQAPSGAGYALENRLVLARSFPDLFRDCRVERLAVFFRTMRLALASLASHARDNPRIVVLTPGPLNEAYFEHAYLARYLGYTLVEGSDLTVRDEQVFLKTLGGLHRVDVILRRTDADFCDPLEIRADSFLGVAGLTGAARAGNVAIANALGSGLVEASALMPLLPRLCRTLLGEDLLLRSVPTWWCGDPEGLLYTLDHLGELVIKPAFPTRHFGPIFTDQLTRDELADLAARIEERPLDFVAQVPIAFSSSPVLATDHLEPRHVMLRALATLSAAGGSAPEQGEYAVMPGGLVRFSNTPEERVVSMQRDGGS